LIRQEKLGFVQAIKGLESPVPESSIVLLQVIPWHQSTIYFEGSITPVNNTDGLTSLIASHPSGLVTPPSTFFRGDREDDFAVERANVRFQVVIFLIKSGFHDEDEWGVARGAFRKGQKT
jgi:hypothetical protein